MTSAPTSPHSPINPSGPLTSASFRLELISHGRAFGPLMPAPTILINLISLPNPPVQMRKKYLGLSPRLRGEFFADPRAQKALSESLKEVEDSMRELEAAPAKGGVEDQKETRQHETQGEDEMKQPKKLDDSNDVQDGGWADSEQWMDECKPTVLRVGVQCEMGRHRSVAMAEELGKALEGRLGWEVEVRHRDIGGANGKASKRDRREKKKKGRDLKNGGGWEGDEAD